jgi:hypothetical protein
MLLLLWASYLKELKPFVKNLKGSKQLPISLLILHPAFKLSSRLSMMAKTQKLLLQEIRRPSSLLTKWR